MLRTILGIAISLTLTLAPSSATDISSKTLDNLQTAFNRESNAHVRYLAFAKRADEEGYGKVASLFRAAARSEEIHAGNQAQVIKKLGAVPSAKIETAVVKPTKENLEAAVKEEIYERDTMYPKFWNRARADTDTDAMRTFTYALSSEAEHVRLFSEALKNLASMKGEGETYYVCTTCGYTTKQLNFHSCPKCNMPKDSYEEVK